MLTQLIVEKLNLWAFKPDLSDGHCCLGNEPRYCAVSKFVFSYNVPNILWAQKLKTVENIASRILFYWQDRIEVL